MIVRGRPRELGGGAPGPSTRSRATRDPLTPVLWLLTGAALAELLLLRTFYRVGIYLPKEGPFRSVHAIATGAGSFAFNLASVLVVLALGMLALRAHRRGRTLAAGTIAAFVAVSLLAALTGALGVAPVVRSAFALSVVLVVRPFVRRPGEPVMRLAAAAVAAAVLLSTGAGLAGDVGRISPSAGGSRGVEWLQLAGEGLVVLSAFLLFAAWVRSGSVRAAPIALGLLPALALLASWRGAGAVTGILVLWTSGLRLFLPPMAYVLALWAVSSAAAGWARSRPRRTVGLALLLVGGFLMESTYLHGLVLVGVVLLTDGVAVGGLPGREARPAARSEEVPPAATAGQTRTAASSASG